jgi:glycosyltransferase involved in cell wall biosynthesis
MEKGKTIIIGLTGHIISDQRINRIARTLLNNGFHVKVYYRHFFKYKTIDVRQDFPFEIRPVNGVFKSGILFYLCYNIALFFKILLARTDYLYAVDSDTLPAFIGLSALKRKPLVFDSHEYFAEVPELSNSPFKKKIWHRITQWGVNYSKARMTVGHELAKVLAERYGKPFATVRNVPAYKPSPEVIALHPPVLLYQGALNKGRELELLINAIKELPEMRCILAGEGDLSHDLRTLAVSYPNIEFAGLLSPETLRELTPKCFAGYNLLAPESLSYYYSLSNKYFDYMHAGVPSISSALPEYQNLNSLYSCGICIRNEQQELVALLKNWLNDQAHYRKLKENAIIASTELNWENEQKSLLNLFNFS